MSAAICCTFRSIPKATLRCNCRFIAGRRRPRLLARNFQSSATFRNKPSGEIPPGRSDNNISFISSNPTVKRATDRPTGDADSIPPNKANADPKYDNASGERINGDGPLDMHSWFFADNVKLFESQKPQLWQDLELSGRPVSRDLPPDLDTDTPSTKGTSIPRYSLHEAVWEEILSTARSGLSLPSPGYANSYASKKSHLILQCPKDGGIYFLDSIVDTLARHLGADIVRMDAQDMSEIFTDYALEGAEHGEPSIRSLSYDVYGTFNKPEPTEEQDDMEEEEDYEENEDEELGPRSPTQQPQTIAVGSIGTLEDLLKSGKFFTSALSVNNSPIQLGRRSSGSRDRRWSKVSFLLEDIVDGPVFKRQSEKSEITATKQTPDVGHDSTPPRSLIFLVRDFKEINGTFIGRKILSRLANVISARRRAGERILMIGTSSCADLMPSFSKASVKDIQSNFEFGVTRTIVITPDRTLSQNETFRRDWSRRIKEINSRHLEEMLLRRFPGYPSETMPLMNSLGAGSVSDIPSRFVSDLEESVWSFDRVQRISSIALGMETKPPISSAPSAGVLANAQEVMNASDEVKYRWMVDERQSIKVAEENDPDSLKEPLESSMSASFPKSAPKSEEKLAKLKKSCNKHEQKLLGGVINPENIKTTFSDVHAPASTIETLRNLTSLSLMRPEEFKYGILASDSIAGLLLYGPPGTGKTLLAKAVAKESGATVLEVSGSELYDMYVGESEKNVRALFSLARKLNPCIVFIDEADAILGMRGGHQSRATHREIINQFLKEWDGLTQDLSTFIMVATNRPFDLDDAVLRRLPRRLLIDLPVERDRTAILGIHLKDEILDETVSIPPLAATTPFYSGSDLKNLCVAAALNCVREANDEAIKAGGSYVFPAKRTLHKRHFDRALEEISASISEDMASLVAIRKFDEKYGDRRGRRKRRAELGFGIGGKVGEGEKVIDTGRVRG